MSVVLYYIYTFIIKLMYIFLKIFRIGLVVKNLYIMLINMCLYVIGCMEEYFRLACDKENKPSTTTAISFTSTCKTVLNSKAKDEQLVYMYKWFIKDFIS